MPSFSYTTPMTNPYTQNRDSDRNPAAASADASLKRLLQSCRGGTPPSVAAVQSITDQLQIQSTPVGWSLDLVLSLSTVVTQSFDAILSQDPAASKAQHHQYLQIPEGSLALLYLLTIVIEELPDNILYAALVHGTEGTKHLQNILDLLVSLTIATATTGETDRWVHRIALIGLSVAYRSLDRLQQLTTLDPNRPDTGWWLHPDITASLLPTAVTILTSRSIDSCSADLWLAPCTERAHLAALSILCTILKREYVGGIDSIDDRQFRDLLHFLLATAQALTNPQLPSSHSKWFLPISLCSVSLLSLIQWRHDVDLVEFDRMVHSTTLVENVARFSFPTPKPISQQRNDGPRWTCDGNNEGARPYALDMIYCWNLAGNEAWSTFGRHAPEWRPCVEGFWNDTVCHRANEMTNNLAKVAYLHHCSRLTTRGIIFSMFQGFARSEGGDDNTMIQSAHTLLTSLLKLFRHPAFSVQILAVRLVWILLSDRRSVSTHDDVSRALWSCLDDNMLEEVVKLVLKTASAEDAKQPLLLVLVDLLDTLVQDQDHADLVLRRLGAESLESLIYLIRPKEVRFDFKEPEDLELSLELESDTPPANNLSRIDDRSLCIEQEDESPPKGMNLIVRLSMATALARLGYGNGKTFDEGVGLLKSRICSGVNDFVANYHQVMVEVDGIASSYDMSKRTFRLQIASASTENQDFVTATLFSTQLLHQTRMANMQQEKAETRTKLQAAEQQVKYLDKLRIKYRDQCRSQSVIFQRELSRMKENTSQDAKQLVAIHASERSTAEHRASEYAQRVEETESQLQQAVRQAENSQQIVFHAKEELQDALTKVGDLQNENGDLSRQISQEEAKASELQDELLSQTEKLDNLFKSRQELESKIHERDQIIEVGEAETETLRGNLEELFADMVSLATVYESKEKEVLSIQRKNHDRTEEVNEKLRVEREQNEEHAAKADQLRRENDKLYKKLAKYKERLETERSEREAHEAGRRKRNGPVSYINQLHQSTSSSDRIDRDKPTGLKENESYRSNRSARTEKENSYSHSSSSLRRKHY